MAGSQYVCMFLHDKRRRGHANTKLCTLVRLKIRLHFSFFYFQKEKKINSFLHFEQQTEKKKKKNIIYVLFPGENLKICREIQRYITSSWSFGAFKAFHPSGGGRGRDRKGEHGEWREDVQWCKSHCAFRAAITERKRHRARESTYPDNLWAGVVRGSVKEAKRRLCWKEVTLHNTTYSRREQPAATTGE